MSNLKHSVISREDLQKVLKVRGFFGRFLSYLGMKLFRLNELNKFYDECYDEDVVKFDDNCLKKLNVNCIVSDSDLNNIPETGPVIVLLNHPYGAVDALLITKSILKRRQDAKFIANFLLSRVEPAAPYLLSVNPFEAHKKSFSSLGGLKEMIKVIEAGGLVCIMPAGEVSTKYKNSNVVEDREWQPNVIKFVQNANVPVVSGFMSGENSRIFHFLGKIHPALRTARLPAEFLITKNRDITVRFSSPMQPKFLKTITDKKILGEILRARTYCLDNSNSTHVSAGNFDKYKEILPATGIDLFKNEIEKIKPTDLLFSTDNYLCFFSKHENIPNIFLELSRLRELTFREVGEGTGNEKDADKFDLYYHHLFIWDEAASAIVGAYRIGMGKEIIDAKGKEGFYINSLFKFKTEFESYLVKSMEMGRSFVVPDYQRKPLPLFLLWKGIYFVTQKYPDYKYLIGPASISSLFSNNSKILMIEYLKRHHSWLELQNMVDHRIGFDYLTNHHHEALLNSYGDDLSGMDRLIKDIDSHHFGFPVLIKKYLSLGGRILEFNVDPDFNYAIDGFVVLDIAVVSETVINSYTK